MRNVAQTVQAAKSAAEVLSAVHGFLSALTPAEVSCLPPGFLAFASSPVQELSHVAVELAQREILASSPIGADAGLLKDASTVLSTAAMRLALISFD